MNTDSSGQLVLFLHDQLQDARIWAGIKSLVSAYAAVRTVSVPPIHTLGPPHAWADHIERYARDSVEDVVDLVVTVGGAGEASIGLVQNQHAHAALLLNPDPQALQPDPSAQADESTLRMLREPEVAGKLTRFFRSLEPHMIEELSTHGTLPDDGVEALVRASLANEQLPQRDMDLLHRIATDQLNATLPLDLDAQQRRDRERPDWISRIAVVADRCVVAVSPGVLYEKLASVLHRRVPQVRIVHLGSQGTFTWLYSPYEISELIHDLLSEGTQSAPS